MEINLPKKRSNNIKNIYGDTVKKNIYWLIDLRHKDKGGGSFLLRDTFSLAYFL